MAIPEKVLPRDLDPTETVPTDARIPIDDGTNVLRATPEQIVAASPQGAMAESALQIGLNLSDVDDTQTAFSNIADTSKFDQEVTGFYWEPDGARIHRLGDRIMVGDSVAYDGKSLGQGSGSWLWDIGDINTSGWIEANASFITAVSRGLAVVGAARQTIENGTVIGITGYAYNNRSTPGPNDKAWAAYIDATRGDGAGTTHGIEVDIANLGVSSLAGAGLNPYAPFVQGTARGVGIASGADATIHPDTVPADVALVIYNNGNRFDSGLVFADNGLTRDGGTTGRAHAIRMAYDHAIEWYEFDTDSLALSIVSQIQSAAAKQELRFNATGMQLLDAAGKLQFRAQRIASAVNYVDLVPAITGAGSAVSAAGDDTNINLVLRAKGTGAVYLNSGSNLGFEVTAPASSVNRLRATSSATGNAVVLSAQGTDTNIDLALTPKGTGRVRLGSHAAIGAETMTGYIEVKDASGNLRKLAVVS